MIRAASASARAEVAAGVRRAAGRCRRAGLRPAPKPSTAVRGRRAWPGPARTVAVPQACCSDVRRGGRHSSAPAISSSSTPVGRHRGRGAEQRGGRRRCRRPKPCSGRGAGRRRRSAGSASRRASSEPGSASSISSIAAKCERLGSGQPGGVHRGEPAGVPQRQQRGQRRVQPEHAVAGEQPRRRDTAMPRAGRVVDGVARAGRRARARRRRRAARARPAPTAAAGGARRPRR